MAASAGTSDKATKEEIRTASANTKPNSRNNRPASDGRNEIGTKTEISTAVVAITAKNTWRVPSTADALRPSPSFCSLWAFSSTTMASSTIRPVARTRASNVKRLIEKPANQMPPSTPISAIGMVVAGINVALNDRKNNRMVTITTTTVKIRVINTSCTDTRMKSASSEMTAIVMSGKRLLTRSTAA